jgi:hypothetical protein
MPSRRQTYQSYQNASPFAGGTAFTFGRDWRRNYDMPYHPSGHTYSAAIRGLYEHRSPRNNNYFHNNLNSRGRGTRPLSVVSIHIVASTIAVFQVIMRIQPHLVVFMDAAATAVVELAAFVTVVRPTALCMVRPTALCSNNVSVGSQS